MNIPFNRPYMTGKELEYISQAHANGHLSGGGPFTAKCERWIEERIGCRKALLAHSGTAALEMAAILADISPGDEVIMPSYTFVSTANAFVLRGGVPVFVDIRPDTLNIDETKIEEAVTARTKAIVAVHYGGVACEMDTIMDIAARHKLLVIEDAACAFSSMYKGRALGSIGHMAVFSFHETKNIISGEGGALILNDTCFTERAEVVREKGTDRKNFFNSLVDKYTWQDIGSSYLPSELIAAFLYAQLEGAEKIIEARRLIWKMYSDRFNDMGLADARGPFIPKECTHNAHMYYLLLADKNMRDFLISFLKDAGIGAVFHYAPLNTSSAGKRYGRVSGTMKVTAQASDRIVRLPLWIGLTESNISYITGKVAASIEAFDRSLKVGS